MAAARTPAKTELTTRSAGGGIRRQRTATAAARIYADLRSELMSLQRRPGEAISEAEIALAHGVSRTPVREAILKLSDDGLVEIFPQSGIFVSRIPLGKAILGPYFAFSPLPDGGLDASKCPTRSW